MLIFEEYSFLTELDCGNGSNLLFYYVLLLILYKFLPRDAL